MNRKSKAQLGQVLVEYILLLTIAVAMATLIVKQFVGRGEKPGFVISNWDKMLRSLGNDLPDCPAQTDFSKPNCPPK